MSLSAMCRSTLAMTLAIGAATLLAAVPKAEAGALGKPASAVTSHNQIILVDGDWDDDWDDDWRYERRYRRHYHGDTYVRAPFARVRKRGWRSTSVDAPFTSVRVRPHGVWVRAPFVNIYVPR